MSGNGPKCRAFPQGSGEKRGISRMDAGGSGGDSEEGRTILERNPEAMTFLEFTAPFLPGILELSSKNLVKDLLREMSPTSQYGPRKGRHLGNGVRDPEDMTFLERKPRNVAGYDKIGTKAMTKSERGESPWKGLKNAGNSGLFRDHTEKVMTFLERSSGQNWNNGLRTVPVRTECQRGRYDKIGTERMTFRVPLFPGFVVLPCTFWNPGAKLWQKLE